MENQKPIDMFGWIFGDKLTDWLILAVIIVQAWIIWRQRGIMSRQLEVIRQQVALARKEFSASHRPHIVVHSVRLLSDDDARAHGKRVPVVEFALVNAGTAGCVIKESTILLGYSKITSKPHIPAIETYEGVRKDAICTGPLDVGDTNNSIIVEAHLNNTGRHEEAQFTEGFSTTGASDGGDWRLYLNGRIVYYEASGNFRTTYFRRVYDRQACRFVGTGDPDDEKTY